MQLCDQHIQATAGTMAPIPAVIRSFSLMGLKPGPNGTTTLNLLRSCLVDAGTAMLAALVTSVIAGLQARSQYH